MSLEEGGEERMLGKSGESRWWVGCGARGEREMSIGRVGAQIKEEDQRVGCACCGVRGLMNVPQGRRDLCVVLWVARQSGGACEIDRGVRRDLRAGRRRPGGSVYRWSRESVCVASVGPRGVLVRRESWERVRGALVM